MDRIVVGVDGSPGSTHALRWAVRESHLRAWPVTAVMAWGYLDQHAPPGATPFVPDYGETQACSALHGFVAAAVGADEAAAVTLRAPCDVAASALVAEASDAALLVVGARGLGGFAGLLLGSVSQHCLHRAPCTVAIVRDRRPRPEPSAGQPASEHIVVGVDGSPAGQAALQWAFDEGRFRHATVEAVHAWQVTAFATDPVSIGEGLDWSWLEDASRETLDSAVHAVPSETISTPAQRSLVRGSAATAILDAGSDADLIVVGARGFGGFRGMLLGSVSQQVAQHARVPVVIVPRSAV